MRREDTISIFQVKKQAQGDAICSGLHGWKTGKIQTNTEYFDFQSLLLLLTQYASF